jgi:hypothetical protein
MMKVNIAKARDGYIKNLLTYEVDFDKGIFTYIPDEDEPDMEHPDNGSVEVNMGEGVNVFE